MSIIKPNFILIVVITLQLVMLPSLSEGQQAPPTDNVVEIESVARMERMLLLKQSLDEGNKLLSANDLPRARLRFSEHYREYNALGSYVTISSTG